MNKKPNQTRRLKESILLRKRAEAKVRRNFSASATQRPAEELLHELQLQQIELEMQNEALRESQIALEKSRDRYLDLYEFAPIGYLTLTRDALIAEINLTGAALLGEDRNKLINRRFTAFVAPVDRDRWHQIFMHTLQHGERQDCELALMRGDGSPLNAQLDSIHLYKEDEVPVVRLTLTDISRRNQALAGERRLRNILDNTLDMIFIFEPDTLRFVYANKGAIGSIGFSREELLQMSALDVLPLIPEPECRSFIAPMISGKKKTRRFETMARRKDGADFPVETQLQLVQERSGSALFVAVVRNITKRKFAEKALRRQKNLMWQVIDMDPNMIFVKDAQGRFLLANQAIADHYGVAIQDMIGKKNGELNPNPQEVEGFLTADREVIEHRREVILTEAVIGEWPATLVSHGQAAVAAGRRIGQCAGYRGGHHRTQAVRKQTCRILQGIAEAGPPPGKYQGGRAGADRAQSARRDGGNTCRAENADRLACIQTARRSAASFGRGDSYIRPGVGRDPDRASGCLRSAAQSAG